MPGTDLLQNVKIFANYIGAVDPCSLKTGLIRKERAEAILAACDACLVSLASALDAGIEESEIVFITVYGQHTPKAMTLAQLQTWCAEIESLANERVYRLRIQQALLQANAWVNDLQGLEALSREQAMFAAETGERLLQVLRDAQAAGIPDGMMVELNDEQVPLSKVRDLGEYIAITGHKIGSQKEIQ